MKHMQETYSNSRTFNKKKIKHCNRIDYTFNQSYIVFNKYRFSYIYIIKYNTL